MAAARCEAGLIEDDGLDASPTRGVAFAGSRAVRCAPIRAVFDIFCSMSAVWPISDLHFGVANPEIGVIARLQKSCGQPLGEAWPRAIRSGTGRGGDVTGSRVSSIPSVQRSRALAVATAGRLSPSDTQTLGSLCDWRLTKRYPVSVQGRTVSFWLSSTILALVGLHRQHRVAFAFPVAHDGDQERLARPSGIDQHLALQQHIIFAVAVAVGRQRPFLDHAPMIHVGHRLDRFVHPSVDLERDRARRSATSRCRVAAIAPLRHSPGFSAQNSTQPIGGRVVSPRLA